MIRSLSTFILAVLLIAPAEAAVQSQSANGFQIQIEGVVPVSPAAAYENFLKVGTWWSSDHSFSGDAANLTIDPVPGGCWCETLPQGGFAAHLRVVQVMPGQALLFSGGLGPLSFMGVEGAFSVRFAPEGEGTRVIWTYAVGGYDKDGFQTLAGAVDGVMAEQFTRFSAVASGQSLPAKPEAPR